jgi:hypothetical protein
MGPSLGVDLTARSRHASLEPEATLLPNQIGDWTQPQFQGHRQTSDGITLNPFYEPLFGAPDVMRAGGQAATLVSNHGLQDYPGSASTAFSGETATAMAHYTMDRDATQSVGGEIERSIVQGTENTPAEISGSYSTMSEDALLGAEQENNFMKTMQSSGIQANNAVLNSSEMREINASSNMPVGAEQETATTVWNDIHFSNLSPQGIQRPYNPSFNAMLANMTQEQRQAINNLPPDKFNEFMRRWESQRKEQMANMNANPMMQQQMPNQPQQFNQTGANMAPGPQNMQQVNAPGAGNQQQSMPMGRMPAQGQEEWGKSTALASNNPQFQMLMDSMDVPPSIMTQIRGLPVDVKKWKDFKLWISQNNTLPPNVRGQLASFQQKQFQVLMQRRAASGQALNMDPAVSMQVPTQQPGMKRQMPNMPPQLLQVSPEEMGDIRSQKPELVAVPDDQLRAMILTTKTRSWQQQQQQLHREYQQQQQLLESQRAHRA